MKRLIKNSCALITGGAGFIGSHLADELIKKQIGFLIIVDNLFLGHRRNLDYIKNSNNFTFINEDACDFSNLNYIFSNYDIDTVFNCATKPLNYSFINPKSAFDTNTKITLNLLELQRQKKFQTLCHFSTSEVYGSSKEELMNEEHILNPTTPYAAGKLAADMAVISYQKCFDLDSFIVRPFNNFGPRQNSNPPLAGVFPITVNRILQNKSPVIEGNGTQSRDFIYVKDTIYNLISLFPVATSGEIYNICSDNEINIKDLILKIAREMSWSGKITYLKNRKSDVYRHRGCSKKIRGIIDFQSTDFDTAVKETINYFKLLKNE